MLNELLCIEETTDPDTNELVKKLSVPKLASAILQLATSFIVMRATPVLKGQLPGKAAPAIAE